MKLRFALNNSFVVQNPVFKIYDNQVGNSTRFLVDFTGSLSFLCIGPFHTLKNLNTSSAIQVHKLSAECIPSCLPRLLIFFLLLHPIIQLFVMQGLVGFCLAIQPTDEDMGTIGRKYEPCFDAPVAFPFIISNYILLSTSSSPKPDDLSETES